MRQTLIFLFTFLFVQGSFGQQNKKNTAAGCTPPFSYEYIDIANVKARINAGANNFWDLVGRPQYEVPKGSGKNSLFTASLWITARDEAGQIRGAAERFRQIGADYFSGPLSTVDATVSKQTCADYDKIYKIDRKEVEVFKAWFNGKIKAQTQNYQIPQSILEWPAHGRNYPPYNEDFYLAPFEDVNGDGIYNPLDGDYPAFAGQIDTNKNCQAIGAGQLYGDQVLWQVFNDKGNIHTETGGLPLGMEIRQQTFAFANTGGLENVVFQGYEIINRSSHTLNDLYVGFWIDNDLGNAQDDYVGCDVSRGVGFAYNGDGFDENNGGAIGYGALLPSIGHKFVMGLLQDPDGRDNIISPLKADWDAANAIPYEGITSNYNDSIVDNERLGMTSNLFHNGDNSVRGHPSNIQEYFYAMRSRWRDGSQLVFAGTGYIGDANAMKNFPTHHMFPGNSDPLNWSTNGKDPGVPWTEITAGNTPFDRRFTAHSGPITMQPGAKNDFIIAYPWAQTDIPSDPDRAVQNMLKVADKAQALFDNCFMPINPPDAPVLKIIEQDQQLVIQLENPIFSNNYQNGYEVIDPTLYPKDSIYLKGQFVYLTNDEKDSLARYQFQGYKVYQVKNENVTLDELEDESKARLIFQTDLKDHISSVFNYEFDEDLQQTIRVEKVKGLNEGISNVFRVNKDYFTEYPANLVNHKTYYYLAVAYAINDGILYDPQVSNTDANKIPYIQSIMLPNGAAITPVSAIPHVPSNYPNTVTPNAVYGEGVPLTKHEGTGNGGFSLSLVPGQEEALFSEPYFIPEVTYDGGKSPIQVTIIDPSNVPSGKYFIGLNDTTPLNGLSDATISLYDADLQEIEAFEYPLKWGLEVPIPELGISIKTKQADYLGLPNTENSGLITSSIEFEGEEWLSGVPDAEGITPQNWILAGRNTMEDIYQTPENESDYDDWDWFSDNGIDYNKQLDVEGNFEHVLNGTWAPFRLAADHAHGPVPTFGWSKPDASSNGRSELFFTLQHLLERDLNQLRFLHSVDIVLTPDKDKWSRVPVIEMADTFSIGGVKRGRLRDGASVDKNGTPGSTSFSSDNPSEPNYLSGRGMSWFPGYAVDIETGERLNMAFGESSYLANYNGRDMIWNPTHDITKGPFDEPVFGGKHYIMVFRNNIVEEGFYTNVQSLGYEYPENRMPAYDEGRFLMRELKGNTFQTLKNVYRSAMWVGLPLIAPGLGLVSMKEGLVPSEARIQIRVQVPFQPYMVTDDFVSPNWTLEIGATYFVDKGPIVHDGVEYKRGESFVATTDNFTAIDSDKLRNVVKVENQGLPFYSFDLTDFAATVNNDTNATSALDRIKVVPNPYYPYGAYGQLDQQTIKITNLPNRSQVNIYTLDGRLVRSIEQLLDAPDLNWDMKNRYGNEVEFGAYLMHVILPNGEEKVLKWFKGESEFDIR